MQPRLARWRAGATVATATAALLLPTMGTAYAGGAAGGQNGYDAQSTKATSTGEGPQSPEVDWIHTMGNGIEVTGSTDKQISFDSAGHVLFQGRDGASDPATDVLIALNPDDGTEAWRVNGIEDQCGVAASDDGFIYGVRSYTGPDDLVVIDAETGQEVSTYDPTLVNDPEFGGCWDSLRLAPDGTLLSLGDADRGKDRLLAYSTEGGTLEYLWHHDYIVDTGDFRNWDLAATALSRPVVSADGDALYMCVTVPEELRPESASDQLTFEKRDLATGAVVDSMVLGDSSFCEPRGMVAVDGGVIVTTEVYAGAANDYDNTLLRVADNGSKLSEDWSVIFSRTEERDQSGTGDWIGPALALSGDKVVASQGDKYTAVDVATGDRLWQYRATSFNNGTDTIAVDASGDMYIGSFGGAEMESFDTNGKRRFAVDAKDLYEETESFGAYFRIVGPDGGLFLSGNRAGEAAAIARIDDGPTQRYSGTNRYGTAAEIATATFTPANVDTVYLAVGDKFPDGLAGGPLAVAGDDPVLLTQANSLPGDTAAALKALSPNRVVALGGRAVVSKRVLQQAAAAAGAKSTDRIAGSNRYETAAEIAGELPKTDVVYLAVGNNFPDSLAGGAATDGAPILLTKPASLPAATAKALAERKPARVVALGGRNAVPQSVLDQAAAAAGGAKAERIFGGNRYGTAVAIADALFPDSAFSGTVYVAVGSNFPDSLSASSAAASEDAPLLLTKTKSLPIEVKAWLDQVDNLERIVILGGPGAVSQKVVQQLNRYL